MTAVSPLLIAGAAGAAAWLSVSDGSAAGTRLAGLLARAPGNARAARRRAGRAWAAGPTPAAPPARPGIGAGPGAAAPRAAGALAGLAIAVLSGSVVGAIAGLAVGAVVARVLGRLEPRAARRRREHLAAQAPEVAELLAACLSSGAPLEGALRAVAEAVGPPVSEFLVVVQAQSRLGAEPAAAWRVLADQPALAVLARAVVRSTRSGAPVADSLVRAAGDLRAQRRGDLLAAARTAGVTAVVPLGVCFLPAFALLGVVPVVASLAGEILRL